MFFIFLMTIEDEEERKSLEALYYKYRYHCLHMARGYTGNEADAEDMVQETFLRVIMHKDRYLKCDKDSFEALLVTIMKNIAKDTQRKKKTFVSVTDEVEIQILKSVVSIETTVIAREELRRAVEEIHKLDEDSQLIMYYKSLSIPTKVVADTMGIQYKTIESKIYRIRKRLKEKIEGVDVFD